MQISYRVPQADSNSTCVLPLSLIDLNPSSLHLVASNPGCITFDVCVLPSCAALITIIHRIGQNRSTKSFSTSTLRIDAHFFGAWCFYARSVQSGAEGRELIAHDAPKKSHHHRPARCLSRLHVLHLVSVNGPHCNDRAARTFLGSTPAR